MVDETNNLLRAICNNLSEGDAINFVVDAEIYCREITNKNNKAELLEQLIGTKAGEFWKIELSELLSTVEECFEYEGEDGSHPNRNYLSSKQINSDTEAILNNLQNLFSETEEIYSFTFADGRDFRFSSGSRFIPIFWGYTFFVKTGKDAFALIGSSCD